MLKPFSLWSWQPRKLIQSFMKTLNCPWRERLSDFRWLSVLDFLVMWGFVLVPRLRNYFSFQRSWLEISVFSKDISYTFIMLWVIIVTYFKGCAVHHSSWLPWLACHFETRMFSLVVSEQAHFSIAHTFLSPESISLL